MQTESQDGWRDLYAFRPRAGAGDRSRSTNWFTCTHPRSRFVTRLLVTEHGQDATRTTLSDFGGEMTLGVETPTGSKREPVARDAVPALLEQRFGLREPEPED
jgi:arylamine N-acetyltransferase